LIFLSPIAGLIAGSIGISTVLLLYMLKLRRRPVAVSSTLLWSQAIKDMEGNIPWQRLSPSVLLLVHLLIVILLSLALARPVLDDAIGDGQRVYLVIDTSASMNATADGKPGIELAKAQAIERVEALFDSGRSARVSVIESSLEPSVVLGDVSERGRLIGAIKGIEPTDQPGEIGDAIGLIESLIEASAGDDEEQESADALVWVFADGGSVAGQVVSMRGGRGMVVSPYGDAAIGSLGNVGIVAIGASRDRSDPAQCRVFVRVVRNDSGPIAAVLRVFDGETQITTRAIAFDDDAASRSETIELRLMQSALLRVEIDVDDALDTDDRAWVRVPDPHPVRITLVAPNANADPLLVDMLEAVARTDVLVVDADEPFGDAELVVYDRVSPESLLPVPTIGFASLLPNQDRSDALEALGNRSRLISWDRADAMMRDAGVGSVSYQRSVMLPTGQGTRALASDRSGAVMIEQVIGSHRHVRAAFALHDSNWAVQVGFPIFLINAIEQLLPGTSGVGEVYTTKEVITNDTESIGPIARIGEIEFAGHPIGVSLLDADESALSVRTDVVIGSGETRSGRFAGRSQRDLWRWFTLAAIALIAFEWFAYARRVKI
jgi:aerotolerance regulator-like protein/VWA domain-containing protein